MSLAGYEQLVALAGREANLIALEAWDELGALDAERAEVVAALPAAPPAGAGELLRALASAQAANTAALAVVRVRAQGEMRTVGQRRTGVRGYQTAAAQR